MKATDLAKIIYECNIHALANYTFVEVEQELEDNDTISVFCYDYEKREHVPKGMYIWFSPPNKDESDELRDILARVFGAYCQSQIFFEDGADVILKIED